MRLHTRCRMSAERHRELREALSEPTNGPALALWCARYGMGLGDLVRQLARELDAEAADRVLQWRHMTERLRDRQTECQALHARAMRAEAELAKKGGG